MDMHEARTNLSGQVPAAASGWAFTAVEPGNGPSGREESLRSSTPRG